MIEKYQHNYSLPLHSKALTHHRMRVSPTRLVGVSKSFQTRNDLATGRSSLIRAVKLEIKEQRNNDDQRTCDNGCDDTRPVFRRVLRSEDSAANNATNATSSDECGRCKSSLPLTADVVRLIREDGWDVRVACCRGEEDAEIASTNVFNVSNKWQANQTHDAVADDKRTTNPIFVAEHGTEVHPDSGEYVWWSNQALRSGDSKAHSLSQNDRQEVRNRVSDGSGQHEQSGETPDLDVHSASNVLRKAEGCRDSIVAILLNSCNDKLCFLLIQEWESKGFGPICGFFWEVGNQCAANEANDNREQALHDELRLKR